MSKPNFFSTGSPFLHHPLLTSERTAEEIDFVLSHSKLTSNGLILDVGCGPGRHSIELAQRGYRSVGIDPSKAMIDAARERAVAAGVQPKFIQVNGEEFFSVSKFDVAICLFTTLGQINNEVQKQHAKASHPLLNGIAHVLIPGGILILEVPQNSWVVANIKEFERFGDEQRYTEITRMFDAKHKIVHESFAIVTPEETRHYLLRYHLYNIQEISSFLINAGFEVNHTFGDFHNTHLTEQSPNMVIVARLAGSI